MVYASCKESVIDNIEKNFGIKIERKVRHQSYRESYEDLAAEIHRRLREINQTRSTRVFIALIISLGRTV